MVKKSLLLAKLPPPPPPPPRELQVEILAETKAVLSWEKPDKKGAEIANYEVKLFTGGQLLTRVSCWLFLRPLTGKSSIQKENTYRLIGQCNWFVKDF